jgi:pimeloyl-ACP methyl ester carboxylesterase
LPEDQQPEALPSKLAHIDPSDPEAGLSYSLDDPTQGPDDVLVVLVGGLALPMQSWASTVSGLKQRIPDVSILAFDRWNRGKSTAPPLNRNGVNDISTSANDLWLLLRILNLEQRRLVLVGQSMGCAIIRMLAIQSPQANIVGVVFIDSMIANSDFTSVFPEPTDDEDPALTSTRQIITEKFHPSVPNPEGISRLNAAKLLPSACSPTLPTEPYLMVLGHDPVYFAQSSEKITGTDAGMILRYLQPAWEVYNEGLTKLSRRAISAVRIVPDTGHFIQVDRPEAVADAIEEVVRKVKEVA